MSERTIFQRTVAMGAVLAVLAGCATVPGQQQAAGDADPCSVGTTAVTGALAGALVGALLNGGRGAVAGAVVGGALATAGCLAYNVQTKQTRTAQQVQENYRKANRNRLPVTPEVVNYSARVNTANVQRGQPFKLESVVEVVDGQKQPVQSVREELLLFTPDGQQVNRDPKSKMFQATSGGRYENSFDMNLPAGVSQGKYAIKTQLYVNDKMVAKRDLAAQVVLVDDMPQIVAIAER